MTPRGTREGVILTDAERVRLICDIAREFGRGCTNQAAGEPPEACEECTAAVLAAFRRAIGKAPDAAADAREMEG